MNKNIKALLLTIGILGLIGGGMWVFVTFPEYVVGTTVAIAIVMLFLFIFSAVKEEMK